MNTYMRALGIISVALLLPACSSKPIDYRSNESLEGPGLFESVLPTSINGKPFKASGDSDSVSAKRMFTNKSADASTQCQLLHEFEEFVKFRNLSKGSKEYEEFNQWLVWRNQESASEQ